jgi:hypothetical protein
MFLNLSYYSGFNPGANLQKKELPLSPVNPISPEWVEFPRFLFKKIFLIEVSFDL